MAGGKWLVDSTLKYGCNDQGEPLRITPGLLEVLEILGDFRVTSTYVSGCAQCYKSVSAWQLAAALITIGRKDLVMVFPQLSIILKIVPTQFKRIVANWERKLGLEKKASNSDSKSVTIHQSALGTARFSAAATTNALKEASGLAVANANNVSFRVDVIMADEASQCEAKAFDSIRRRALQSAIPTRPERFSGTPGGGGGIELAISKATYEFHAHHTCANCGEVVNLSPLGCLLKPDGLGRYFDSAGRPIDWHMHDELDKAGSAYFGCFACAHEITKEQRLAATFRCVKTGIRLRDVLDGLPYGVPNKAISAGIILSPLLRDTGHMPARDIIIKGLEGSDVVDWHQQELGIPTKTSRNGITIGLMQAAREVGVPLEPVYKKVWGLDQGTTEHWLCVVNYRLPSSTYGLSDMQIYEQSHRELVIARAVHTDDLDNLAHTCDGGCLDNEPGREYAAKIVSNYRNSFAFDQRGGKQLGGKVAKKGVVESGGTDLEVMLCDTHRLQDMILASFSSGRFTLPLEIDCLDMRASSLARHLTTSARNTETGVWTRPADHKDDLLKALMGCELWYYLEITGRGPARGGSIADIG